MRFCRTSKSIRNNTIKKCSPLLRWPCLIQDIPTDVYCSKQTGSSTKGNHHPSFLHFTNWAEETVDAAKICGSAENVVKTETQQTFINGLLGYYFRHLYSRWKRVCIAHNNCMSCPSMSSSICYSLIYFWVPSSCFCIK